MNEKYKNIYGTWEVKTEGDIEGRTTTHLGTFTGFVDEIALYLANRSYYSLKFKKIKPVEKFEPTRKHVSVCFDIESGTWDSIKTPAGIAEMQKVFKDRPVDIVANNSYAAFSIKSRELDEDINRTAR